MGAICESWDRFVAHAFAGPGAAGDSDPAIGRNDGLGQAVGMAAGLRILAAVAAALIENSSARAGNSAADNFAADAIHSAAADAVDSFVAEPTDGCFAAGTHSEAAMKADWIFVLAVAGGAVGFGEKTAAGGRCDDFARGTALPLTPAS